jgi:chaperonin GroES
MNVKPLGDRVLVQLIENDEVKKGGIIIPDTAKEKPQVGKVVALGTGGRDEHGKAIPFDVKKGDKVYVSKYGGDPIEIDGKEYQLFSQSDIKAIIE